MNCRLHKLIRNTLLGGGMAVGCLSSTGNAFAQTAASADAVVASDVVALNNASFRIPFSIDARGKRPAQVQLWVSTDSGSTWQMHGSREAEEKNFNFRAAAEGEYLFLVRSVDEHGTSYPSQAKPMRVLIDTSVPQITLNADMDIRGLLTIAVQAADDHLNFQTATLRVRSDRDGQWQDVSLGEPQKVDDQYRWDATVQMSQCREVAIAFQVFDQAQNNGLGSLNYSVPRTATLPGGMTLASGAGRPQLGQQTPYQVPAEPQRFQSLPGATQWTAASPRTREIASGVAQPPTRHSAPVAGGRSSAGQLASSPAAGRNYSPVNNRTGAEELPPPPLVGQQPGIAPQSVQQRSVGSRLEGEAPGTAAGLARSSTPAPAKLPVQVQKMPTGVYQCNARACSLDYEVQSLGGSALSTVQLWGSQDSGASWEKWGADPDRVSPFDVKVANDGLFGFRMVVVSANGLISNRPSGGDDADVWIRIDTSIPEGRITRAVYGQGASEGQLIIDYQTADDQLIGRPASLYYRTARGAEWQLIAQNLPASDTYLWKPPVNLPDQIYLQVEAVDKAGNVGRHELAQPIDVKGLAPRGRIHRVRPIRTSP